MSMEGGPYFEENGQWITLSYFGPQPQPSRRYYVFNKLQREKAMKTGSAFFKKNSDSIATVEDLKDLLKDGGGEKSLSKRLEWWAKNLRGTSAFKKAKRGELKDLVACIGLPTYFLTLSAADLHWAELHKEIIRQNPDAAHQSKMQRIIAQP